jgi:4-hydroxyacetophenone monooxygenase
MAETDEAMDAALRAAALPALLVALAHATGDLSLLHDDLRPDPELIQDPNGGLSEDQRATARELAAGALVRLFEQPGVDPHAFADDDGTLRRLFTFLVGQPVSDDYLHLLREELGGPGHDRRAPQWHKDELDPARPFRVVVIGAGMSGLVVGRRLQQAGVPFVIVEKNADVGGTWYENRYPGCRVDVPNHLYSYSFFQREDWPQRFSTQEVLLGYFRECTDALDLRPHIRFSTEVIGATYREESGKWVVRIRGHDGTEAGTEADLEADVVVSAVGQLNRPRLPSIEGREHFAGASFHSAQWDTTVSLTGKRVAVIGTAASAIQLIPAIADDVAELHVYQRTPNWFLPTPDYYAAVPDGMHWLIRHVPGYSTWYRLSLFWRLAEGALSAARVDPEWDDGGHSVSDRNAMLRALMVHYLETQFADRPDLLARIVPTYPPLAKRILLDNGIWASTLKRQHVQLVTEPIERITEAGIVAGGELREVDVIVYATGFEASRFLTPLEIVGRGGVELHDHWAGDPRAYLGLTVPGFPNLFCMYGPNTNLVANGSIIFFSECEAQYILSAVRLLLEQHAQALDCRRDVHDAYNVAIDEGNTAMAWGATVVNSWYRSPAGRITQNWPFTLLEFWQRTRAVDPADYELTAREPPALTAVPG